MEQALREPSPERDNSFEKDLSYRDAAYIAYEEMLRKTQPPSQEQKEIHYALYRRNLLQHLPKDKSAVILDAGCGFGDVLQFLKNEGYQNISGFDIAESNVAYCKERGLPVEHGEAHGYLAASKATFDCIIFYDVLEHFSKDEGFGLLKLAHDRLNPGGQVLAVLPNMANPLTAGRSRYSDLTHEAGYTQESLSFLFSLANFESSSFYSIDHCVLPNPLLNACGRIGMAVFSAMCRALYLLNGVSTVSVFSKNMLALALKKSD